MIFASFFIFFFYFSFIFCSLRFFFFSSEETSGPSRTLKTFFSLQLFFLWQCFGRSHFLFFYFFSSVFFSSRLQKSFQSLVSSLVFNIHLQCFTACFFFFPLNLSVTTVGANVALSRGKRAKLSFNLFPAFSLPLLLLLLLVKDKRDRLDDTSDHEKKKKTTGKKQLAVAMVVE